MAVTWLLRFWFMGLIGITLAKSHKSKAQTPGAIRAAVGRFSISIKDNRLPQDPNVNISLINNLLDLTDGAFNLWLNETFPLTPEEAVSNLTVLATQYLTGAGEFDTYHQPLIDLANQTFISDTQFLFTNGCSSYLNASFESAENDYPEQIFLPRCYSDEELEDYWEITPEPLINNHSAIQEFEDGTFFDFVSEYTQAAYNTSVISQFYRYAALMGVGRTVSCSDMINTVLETKDPWANAGSSAATTLMALLPTFLAFGNLYVPRSSEVYATSILVGLGSSLYSFGLPVQSLTAIPGKQTLLLSTFGIATLAMIASFASVDKNNVRKPSEKPNKNNRPTLTDLQEWSEESKDEEYKTSMDEAKSNFAQIKNNVIEKCVDRWHWYYLPSVFVAGSQAIMFGLAVYPLLADIGAPRFLFTCHTNWTGFYLAVTASANALFRFFMWEIGNHERVLVYSLSRKSENGQRKQSLAEKKLRELINKRIANSAVPLNSMETELPPLYPPFLSLVWSTYEKIHPQIDARKNWPRYKAHLGQDETTKMNWSRRAFQFAARGTKNFFVKNLYHAGHMWSSIKTFQMLNIRGRSDTSVARRFKPLVILIHLSTSGRNFFMTLLTGFIEAALFLLLTFFLASQWGGNLIITGFALALLLIFVTAGRALGLVYVWLTTHIWGLTTINCDSHEEILGSLRIICSMKEVLVHVNGATYFEGYRLNGSEDFDEWQKEYDAGKYDVDDDDDFSGAKQSPSHNSSDIEMGNIGSPELVGAPQPKVERTATVEIHAIQPSERPVINQSESSDQLLA